MSEETYLSFSYFTFFNISIRSSYPLLPSKLASEIVFQKVAFKYQSYRRGEAMRQKIGLSSKCGDYPHFLAFRYMNKIYMFFFNFSRFWRFAVPKTTPSLILDRNFEENSIYFLSFFAFKSLKFYWIYS